MQYSRFRDESGFECVILAERIFANSMVRRRLVSIDIERRFLVDFVVNMSVLHHSVRWSVFFVGDERRGAESSEVQVSPRPTVLDGQQMKVREDPWDILCYCC